MTYIPWFICLLVAYSIILSVYSKSNDHDALIFYPGDHAFDNCNFKKENHRTCAIACPTTYEDDAVTNISYGNTPLFIQEIDLAPKLREKNTGKCERGFTMSSLLISRKEGKLVEFGFQIFYERSKFQRKLDELVNFNNVTKVSDGDSILKSAGLWLRHHLHLARQHWRLAKKKLGFTWISKIQVRYNFSSGILKWVAYKIRLIETDQIDQLEVKCHDYKLFTNQYNTDEHMEMLYEKNNQRTIFEKFAASGQSCTECVKKHNLILAYQLQASSPDEISCSNMTTIPLWHDIPDKLMDRIEKFVIAVAQVLIENIYIREKNLEVRAGVVGQLNLLSHNNEKQIKVYLDDEEKKVPVPNVVYKLVRYGNPYYSGDRYAYKSPYFYIVIVVHNNRQFTPEERVCPNDQCKSLGWDSIQYLSSDKSEGNKLNFVYCCKLNTDVAESISYPWKGGESDPLDLGSLGNVNLSNKVALKFKELVGEKTEEDD